MPKQSGDAHWHLENTYMTLPTVFYTPQVPTLFPKPVLRYFNDTLADSLGFDRNATTQSCWAQRLTGMVQPLGSQPIALAYAGHQYGQFSQLGDGRAQLLGEQVTPAGERFDLHLKGSGPTAYSRGFDGKGTYRSMVREAIISEAMHALGIPSTRTLAVTTTGERIRRERWHEGAVLCRVARSHLRVGTFQHAALQDNPKVLHALLRYAISRHDPTLMQTDQPYALWLRAVADRQARLIAAWQSIGFVHGVMNTDNMSIAGETIDYGPCAFLDRYDEAAVFSSIDHDGRYAFKQQPYIASWNLARLAEAILPVLHEDRSKALAAAQAMLDHFAKTFTEVWQSNMAQKLGFDDEADNPLPWIETLLAHMQRLKLDYTHTFLTLSRDPFSLDLPVDNGFDDWRKSWLKALETAGVDQATRMKRMQAVNPARIPRNHLVEQVLDAMEEADMAPFDALMKALSKPYDYHDTDARYEARPDPTYRFVSTCGT